MVGSIARQCVHCCEENWARTTAGGLLGAVAPPGTTNRARAANEDIADILPSLEVAFKNRPCLEGLLVSAASARFIRVVGSAWQNADQVSLPRDNQSDPELKIVQAQLLKRMNARSRPTRNASAF